MWHKPCRTFHPWCPCIKTRCLLDLCEANHPSSLRYGARSIASISTLQKLTLTFSQPFRFSGDEIMNCGINIHNEYLIEISGFVARCNALAVFRLPKERVNSPRFSSRNEGGEDLKHVKVMWTYPTLGRYTCILGTTQHGSVGSKFDVDPKGPCCQDVFLTRLFHGLLAQPIWHTFTRR